MKRDLLYSILGSILIAHLFEIFCVADWGHYQRLHIMISPDSNYFPTYRELEFNTRKYKGSQSTLISGGSSFSAGAGVTQDKLWSSILKSKLGKDYNVLNYAARGGAGQEFGFIAASILHQSGDDFVYLFDSPPYYPAYSSTRWSYSLLNACLKNPDIIGASNCWSVIKKHVKQDLSSSLKFFLDFAYPNQTFWNWVSYSVFQFNYHRYITSEKLFSARQRYGVIENDSGLGLCEKQHGEAYYKGEVQIVSGYSRLCPWAGSELVDGVALGKSASDFFSLQSDGFWKKTLIVYSQAPAVFYENVPEDEIDRQEQCWGAMTSTSESYGAKALHISPEKWSSCDMADRTHMANPGSEKYADWILKNIELNKAERKRMTE